MKSILGWLLDKHKHILLFTSVNQFWVLKTNKPNVNDPVNELNKERKSNSDFNFWLFLPNILNNSNGKLQIVLNNLINFYYDKGENKYITTSIIYLACRVKYINDNQICPNKQQVKYRVLYLFFLLLLFHWS